MNFFDTPLRRLCLVRACGYLVLALALGALPFIVSADEDGRIFSYGAAGVCVVLSLFNLWKARRTPSNEVITMNPERASIPTQIRYFRRMLWLSLIAFPPLTIWVAYELHQLESGREKEVSIPAPLLPIYEHLGYWPTVISLLVVCIGCCTVFVVRIRRLSKNEK